MTGKEIRALRERLGLKQDDLAKALGISFSTVSRWETEAGNAKPNDTQEQQLEALEYLVDKAVEPREIKKLLQAAGVAGAIAIAVGIGVTIPGSMLAGSLSGLGVLSFAKKIFGK